MSELLERDAELGALEHALDATLGGRGEVLVVEGGAGLGKSSLLRRAAGSARDRGMLVLSATGGEMERAFPFGMVRQLLEPVVLGASPERRAALLDGASAPAGPILGAVPQPAEASADAGFATLHGLYWLIAALADEQPIALVFDDAHWADAPSLRFLDFLARRVTDLPLLAVVALRPREPGAEWQLLEGLKRSTGADVLRPGLLSRDAAAGLMRAELGDDVPAEAISAAHAATGGNPLLMRELARSLSSSGTGLTVESVAAAVPSSVTRSVEHRLAGLPEAIGQVALALAVLGYRQGPDVIAAATGIDQTGVSEALDALRDVELVTGDPPGYAHPLLREAVAEAAPRSERDRLHIAAARHLRGRVSDQDQLLVHLLAAAPLREDWAIALLREGARRALAEGAPDAAVTRLRRAVDSTDGMPDPALLLELGQASLSAGDPARALDQLTQATESDDPVVRATAIQARVATEILTGEGDNGARAAALDDALGGLGADAPEALVDDLRGNLLNSLTLDTNLAAERTRQLERMQGFPLTQAVESHIGWELACGDAPAREVVEHCARALADRPYTRLEKIERGVSLWAVVALHVVDGRDLSDAALADADATARRTGSRIGRAYAANMRAEWELVFDSASRAEANAHQALEIWTGTQLQIMVDTARGSLGDALVLMDRLDEAEEVLAPAVIDETSYTSCIVLQARAALAMAQGRPHAALADLDLVQRICDGVGWRRFARATAGAQHALALARAGREEEGLALAEEERAFGARTGRVTIEAAALTSLGAIAGGDDGIAHLENAVEVATRSRSPLVQARASVELGSALRRGGRRSEARDRLRQGGEQAAAISARLLQNRALEELAIAGARQRDPFSSGVDSLTPSERRVAEHAARGLTNREIAETLFVTQKTIEVHLGNAYSKLEIRSRNQLAQALGDPAATDA